MADHSSGGEGAKSALRAADHRTIALCGGVGGAVVRASLTTAPPPLLNSDLLEEWEEWEQWGEWETLEEWKKWEEWEEWKEWVLCDAAKL